MSPEPGKQTGSTPQKQKRQGKQPMMAGQSEGRSLRRSTRQSVSSTSGRTSAPGSPSKVTKPRRSSRTVNTGSASQLRSTTSVGQLVTATQSKRTYSAGAGHLVEGIHPALSGSGVEKQPTIKDPSAVTVINNIATPHARKPMAEALSAREQEALDAWWRSWQKSKDRWKTWLKANHKILCLAKGLVGKTPSKRTASSSEWQACQDCINNVRPCILNIRRDPHPGSDGEVDPNAYEMVLLPDFKTVNRGSFEYFVKQL